MSMNFDNLSESEGESESTENNIIILNGEEFQIFEEQPKENSFGKSKKKQYRFNCASDIKLLKEVVAINPYSVETRQATKLWDQIAQNLNVFFEVDGRRCRERTNLLMGYFRKEDNKHLRKSGVEEDFTERNQLLQEIKELQDEALSANAENSATPTTTNPQSKRKKDAEMSARGLELRKQALISRENIETDSSPSPDATHQKRGKRDVYQLLVDKMSNQADVKQKELALREREIALRERELAFRERVEEDRREKSIHETEERKLMLQLLTSLVEKLKK